MEEAETAAVAAFQKPSSDMPFPSSFSRTQRYKLILTGSMVVLVALVTAVLLVVFIPGRKGTPSSEVLLWKGQGTTEQLHEIVLERCYNYVDTVNPELGDKDCLQIWELFQNAFMYKHPCRATEEDFQPLMDFARQSIPCNKSLFWSKTKDLVHCYTKANGDFLTLEDTLLGYMADGLSWCGDPSSPGVNYESCPHWTECKNNPGSMYWKMASKMFAEAACGVTQVMLNGSIEAGAFRNNSIFGSVEVVNLNPNRVSKMQIWLMHDIDGPKSETCMGQSILKLTTILESRNISVSCEDNYRGPQHQRKTKKRNSTCLKPGPKNATTNDLWTKKEQEVLYS